MLFRNRGCWAVFLCWLSFAASAQAQVGEVAIDNFKPLDYYSKDYVASPQNWGIVQDHSGRLFVGNQSGILVFDGVRWDLVPGTERLNLFKLAADQNGRVYSGGLEDLGYVDFDGQGAPFWHSLKPELPDSLQAFRKIFNVVEAEEKIYFLSGRWMFAWDGDTFQKWRSQKGFRRIFPATDGLFVIDRDRGIAKLSQGDLTRIARSPSLSKMDIRGLVELDVDEYLLLTHKDGIYRLWGERVEPVNPPLDSITVLNVCPLSNGEIAAATREHGVYILNRAGAVTKIIDESNGLQQNQSIWPYVDREGALWVGLYSGLSRINYPAANSWFRKSQGMQSIVASMLDTPHGFYVGTLNGCFRLGKQTKNGVNPFFHRASQIKKETWQLLDLQETILAVTAQEVYQIDATGVVNGLNLEGSFKHGCRSIRYPNRVYLARNQEVVALEFKGRQLARSWVFARLPHSISQLAEDEEGRLWAADYQVSKMEPQELEQAAVFTFDSLSGWHEAMDLIELTTMDGKLLMGTNQGIFEYDASSNRLSPCNDFGTRWSKGQEMAYLLTPTEDGDLWLFSESATGPLVQQEGWKLDAAPLATEAFSEAWKIYEDKDSIVWISTTEGLIRHDPQVKPPARLPFQVQITAVESAVDSLVQYHLVGEHHSAAEDSWQLPYTQNSIRFQYSGLYYSARNKMQYRFSLEGNDENWSGWGAETTKEYNNLWEGTYTFKVQARNGFGTESDVATYTFTVLPPWYRSWLAFGVYTLLALLFVGLLLQLYTARLRKAKRKLELLVEDRTAEIASKVNELEAVNKQLVELDQFKEGMTHMIAHDLKNPLNVVIGSGETASTSGASNAVKEAGRQMMNLVSNMLDVSKYEHTSMALETVSVWPRDLIAKAVEQVDFLAKQHRANIQVRAGIEQCVLADPPIVERVLVNLLTNAIKYSDTSGQIALGVEQDKTHLRFSVSDNGPGISSEQVPTIFEKFGQLAPRNAGHAQSTGLGLAFCKMAIEAHGGTIGVTSKLGHGARFWFTLPIDLATVQEQQPLAVTDSAEDVGTQLSMHEKQLLEPIAAQLRELPIYRHTQIRTVLAEVDATDQPTVQAWVQEVEQCLFRDDEARYAQLLKKLKI